MNIKSRRNTKNVLSYCISCSRVKCSFGLMLAFFFFFFFFQFFSTFPLFIILPVQMFASFSIQACLIVQTETLVLPLVQFEKGAKYNKCNNCAVLSFSCVCMRMRRLFFSLISSVRIVFYSLRISTSGKLSHNHQTNTFADFVPYTIKLPAKA